MTYVLLIVLAGQPTAFPLVSWHLSRESCQVEFMQQSVRLGAEGIAIEHVSCSPHEYPAIPARPLEFQPCAWPGQRIQCPVLSR